jgi:hypothetical protein
MEAQPRVPEIHRREDDDRKPGVTTLEVLAMYRPVSLGFRRPAIDERPLLANDSRLG